jgi:hypothetical protein
MEKPSGQRTASGIIGLLPDVFLKHKGSGVTTPERLFPAAIKVVRKQGDIAVDRAGKILMPPTLVVICKRLMRTALGLQNVGSAALKKLRMGEPVDAILAGKGHHTAVLPWSTEQAPTVLTDCCFGVGVCQDADRSCGACCNNHNRTERIPIVM